MDEINLNDISFQLTEKDSKTIIHQMNTLIYTNKYHSRKITEFPGSHPITLLRKHIDILLHKDYYVCEKSDGVRALLYIFKRRDKIVSVFVDRKNQVYEFGFHFNEMFDTVFDGEVYFDVKNGRRYLVYAIFDTLLYNSINVMEEPLLKRLDCAYKVTKTLRQGQNHVYVIVKKMYKSYGFCEVYKKIPEILHKNDGMIFTPVLYPYVPGRCDILFKWKPSHLNTVDLIMKRKENMNFVYELLCFGKNNILTVFDYFVDFDGENENRFDGCVGEFSFVEDKTTIDIVDFTEITGGWDLHKIRTDKTTPNSYKVVMNVLSSINENLSYEDLESYYDSMRNNWKKRESKTNY